MPRTAWLVVSLVAAASGVGVWAFHRTPQVRVDTAAATEGPIARPVVATGTVKAIATVEVGSQVSGTIAAIGADFNDIVKAGQVIARLDPSLFTAARDQTAAALEEALAALQRAQTDLDGLHTAERDAQIKFTRTKALADQDLLEASELDAARIALDEATADVRSGEARVAQARGGVEQAKAAFDQASVGLDRTIVRAPIDGIVVERDVDVGQTVAASVQAPVLFRIASDLRRVEVDVDVDEADIGGVAEGEPASFGVESYPNQTFEGVIRQIRLQPVAEQTTTATTVPSSTAPAATTQVATVVSYTVIVGVENPDERLRPGMTAEVSMQGAHEAHTLRIPNAALAFRPSDDVLEATGGAGPAIDDPAAARDRETRPREVWRYDGRRLTPVVVRTGLADDRWTELTSGQIHDGDRLATNAVIQR
jgi:HlyD family secretion protein